MVSTLNEAEMYADNGFDDILYGYPLSEHHMQRNFQLASKLDQYHVMINSLKSVETLVAHDPPKSKKWSVYLKIDVGYSRAGIPFGDKAQILNVAKKLNDHKEKVELQGLYAHCGNSYQGSNDEEVKYYRDQSILRINEVAEVLKDKGVPVKHQGTGSTPSCSQDVSDNPAYNNLTEIHPGNYAFYDIQQREVSRLFYKQR